MIFQTKNEITTSSLMKVKANMFAESNGQVIQMAYRIILLWIFLEFFRRMTSITNIDYHVIKLLISQHQAIERLNYCM